VTLTVIGVFMPLVNLIALRMISRSTGSTKLLADIRDQAVDVCARPPWPTGENAVLATRFDCNEIAALMGEVPAYGTAVTMPRSG
jgi:uncharacterized protein YbjQ (UPF0145 family)